MRFLGLLVLVKFVYQSRKLKTDKKKSWRIKLGKKIIKSAKETTGLKLVMSSPFGFTLFSGVQQRITGLNKKSITASYKQ
jgi:hypothetical protein